MPVNDVADARFAPFFQIDLTCRATAVGSSAYAAGAVSKQEMKSAAADRLKLAQRAAPSRGPS